MKADQSPVTAADEASEAVILQGVARLLPDVPVVSEESADVSATSFSTEASCMVDPLDGTREFLAGRDEFTVNLAIVTRGVPIAGIIAAPKRGQVWRGVVGVKAERLRLLDDGADQPQNNPHPRLAAPRSGRRGKPITSRRGTDAFLVSLGSPTRNASGSAIKFCQIAEGDCRCLSAARNDLRMGRGGRSCARRRRRRRGDKPARLTLGIRPRRREFSRAGLHCLGRSRTRLQRPDFEPAARSLSQIVGNLGPFALGGVDDAARIGEEGARVCSL